MDSTIIASIIGVSATILGVFIGYKLSVKGSLEAINRQEFNRASSEFRVAFTEVERLLAEHYIYEVAINKHGKGVRAILYDFFVDHERAVIRFRPYLSQSDRVSFNRAWEEYCCKDDWQIPFSCYSQDGGHDPQKETEFMKLAMTHIENLLSYATPMND